MCLEASVTLLAPFEFLKKTLEKHRKVRFLSSPLKNQRFSQCFSHFWPVPLEFWCAHAGSVHSVVRRWISRRAPKIESFFESRWVAKTLGFCMAQSGIDPRPSRR
jgi:hypothetical protein